MSLPQSHRMLPLGLQLLYLHIKAHMNQTLWGTVVAHQWIVSVWFLYLYHYVQSNSQVSLLSKGDPWQVQHHQLWTYRMIISSSVYPFILHLCTDMSIAFSLYLMHIQPSRMVKGLVQNCYLLWEKQKVLLLSQENKMADKVGFCTSNFIFSVLHHRHSWVCLVYWICATVSSIYLLICHCILLIIQVLIFVNNSQSACADGLCLVYFIHLINICFILL
jgi:hypothetical protein